MGRSLAVLSGSLIIAASILFVFRWEINVVGGGSPLIIVRLDRWTGSAVYCAASPMAGSGGNVVATFAGVEFKCIPTFDYSALGLKPVPKTPTTAP